MDIIACHVCSKLVGIGACEISWSDLKMMCGKKSSHVDNENIRKQCIIYSSCRLSNNEHNYNSNYTNDEDNYINWDEDDLECNDKITNYITNDELNTKNLLNDV